MNISQKQKAEKLRALHHGPDILLFPNVWDVASARIIEHLGLPALATSSAAIANMLGYPDGQQISSAEMLRTVAHIARAVNIPVTADMEAGYSNSAVQMHQVALQLIESGAVGLNLEDGEDDEARVSETQAHVEKIQAVKEASSQSGVPLVINARTDAYWAKTSPSPNRFAECVRRANLYREAGADCIFVPGMKKIDEIKKFLQESPGPMNVLGGPGAPTIAELKAAGVRRVSLGSSPSRAALGLLREIATELKSKGTYDTVARYVIPADEVNAMFAAHKKSADQKN
jgi:2-methylisocitrate lyase-like PEP mutase family enzyme